MSNVIELRLLDHCVHPMCYVMDVMTNLRQYYSNSHKITKPEDISNPFEVLERQTLEVENIVEKNKYLPILFFSQLYFTLVKNLTQRAYAYVRVSLPLQHWKSHKGAHCISIFNSIQFISRTHYNFIQYRQRPHYVQEKGRTEDSAYERPPTNIDLVNYEHNYYCL